MIYLFLLCCSQFFSYPHPQPISFCKKSLNFFCYSYWNCICRSLGQHKSQKITGLVEKQNFCMTASPFGSIAVSHMSGCLDGYDFFISDLEENRMYFRIVICILFKDHRDASKHDLKSAVSHSWECHHFVMWDWCWYFAYSLLGVRNYTLLVTSVSKPRQTRHFGLF